MYEQNEKLKDDNVWKAYWVLVDKSFPPRCTADFSRRAHRFDSTEPRSYVYKSLGALLRQRGVVVALFWLMKPRSRILSSSSSNGDVHKIFFIVFLLRLSRITKLVLKAKIDEQLVFYLFAGTRKKVSQPFFILLHDNKLSLLYAGIFKTVCIIFEVMVTFLSQSYISSPCPALSNMKQTKIITNV